MVKFIALYKRPDDPAAFDKHYFEIHAPLAAKMPGLRRMEVSRITGTPMGPEAPFYLLAELYFDNLDAAKAALASPEGKAAGKDVMGFAGKIITMMFAEVRE
jgi:uncharacterized protein (TIGR02118 family)